MLAAATNVSGVCMLPSGCSTWLADWVTQWLRASSGILVVAPALVLWSVERRRAFDYEKSSFGNQWALPAAAVLASGLAGFMAFGPLLELPGGRMGLALLPVFPLLWAALRCSQRDAALCMLVVSILAAWGAWPGAGPFGSTANESFLVSNLIVISLSVLALVVSADAAQRQSLKAKLSRQEGNVRALLSHADMGIARIDGNGRFTLVNSRYCELVHRPPAQLLQQHLPSRIFFRSLMLRRCRSS
jgi:integral membrane sensor domain MASE1